MRKKNDNQWADETVWNYLKQVGEMVAATQNKQLNAVLMSQQTKLDGIKRIRRVLDPTGQTLLNQLPAWQWRVSGTTTEATGVFFDATSESD